MTRPAPESDHPYTRSAVCSMVGVGVPTLKNFLVGIRKLKRRHRGTGNWNGFSFSDALRVAVAKELLRLGVQVASISELFDAIETPIEGRNKGWAWLRTEQARVEGATIVMISSHPLSPSAAYGAVYLTTAHEAAAWLVSKRSASVRVIDVNVLINHLEQVTGERYQGQPADHGPLTTN